jgi:ADP-ribose pyrophosphatase YjhB (NUDIX family)
VTVFGAPPPPPIQVGAFGDPGRDPRGWCVTAAYVALVPSTELGVKAAVRPGGVRADTIGCSAMDWPADAAHGARCRVCVAQSWGMTAGGLKGAKTTGWGWSDHS